VRLLKLLATVVLTWSSLGRAQVAKLPSIRDNSRWQQAKPLERAHLTALQAYRLNVDVGCAVQAVLVKLQASKDEATAAELNGYAQAWVDLGSKLYPDPALAEMNKKFPKLALALETESLTFRDLIFTFAQLRLGSAVAANQKPGAKPPFAGDVTGAGEYLWSYGDGLKACGVWKGLSPSAK
jgi:hypothetical protein